MGVKCFLLRPAGKHRLYLRRYVSSNAGEARKCTVSATGYHDARQLWKVARSDYRFDAKYDTPNKSFGLWPDKCACGYVFSEADEWQKFEDEIMKRADTGVELTRQEARPGAMWFADWMQSASPELFRGSDGHTLIVKLPNGNEWCVDGPSSNCTKPDDHVHKCWVRHGAPPLITVDKNGNTCEAGAGSIQSGNYHGFLRNGEFTD